MTEVPLTERIRNLSPGGAPDPERVAAIRAQAEADPDDGFADRALTGVKGAVERLLAEARHGDFVEAEDLIRHARHKLEALDPARLTPRRGIAGLFDSRGARLKRFRADYQAAGAGISDTAAELARRAEGCVRRNLSLETLHAETRRLIAEADAAVAAGAQLLTNRVEALREVDSPPAADPRPPLAAPPLLAADEVDADDTPRVERIEAVADLPAAVEAAAVPETVSPDPPSPQDRAERLTRQLAALIAARGAAVGQLPLARAVQNAEHAAPAELAKAAEALSAWVEDWRHGLGLAGRKARRIRPDAIGLARSRDLAVEALDACEPPGRSPRPTDRNRGPHGAGCRQGPKGRLSRRRAPYSRAAADSSRTTRNSDSGFHAGQSSLFARARPASK